MKSSRTSLVLLVEKTVVGLLKALRNCLNLRVERRQNKLEYSSASALTSKTLLEEKFSNITCVTRRENRSWVAKSAKNPIKLTSERRQNQLEYSSASALSSKTLLDEKFSNIACVARRENRSWIAKIARNPFKLTRRRQRQLEYCQR